MYSVIQALNGIARLARDFNRSMRIEPPSTACICEWLTHNTFIIPAVENDLENGKRTA